MVCKLVVLVCTFLVNLNSISAWGFPFPRSVAPGVRSTVEEKRFRYPLRLADISEKLVFDTKSGRFYERDLSEICEEEFCLLDPETQKPILLTKEEKERVFLDAVQSYYFSGKSNLPDDQFDRLREDLSWEGSALVTLNRNETLFLNAMQAYMKGAPVLSDIEFDDLKTSLKEAGSKIAVSTSPKCYVDTGVCKVTWRPDIVRTGSLYIPASLLNTLFFIGLVYEVPGVRYVNPLITLILGAYPIALASRQITEQLFFKEPSVASGPCPVCGVENHVFFGDVLGVVGDSDESTVKCTNCKSSLTIKRSTLRVSTLKPSKSNAPAAKVDEE